MVRNGRAGQTQHGVDIVGTHGALRPVGLQCKRKARWPVNKLSAADVDDEIDEARNFRPKLKTFYILTTAPNDAKLLEHVRRVNEKQAAAGEFNVVVLGWSEIVRRATLHPAVADKHFGTNGSGPSEPLLANFYCSNGKLEITGDELEVTCREIAHDFRINPSGRIAVRQKEADQLAATIASYQGRTLTLDERKKRLELLDRLKRLEDAEARIAWGLKLMLSEPRISVWMLQVYQNEGNLSRTVSGFIQYELDARRGSTNPTSIVLRLTSPKDDQIRRSVEITRTDLESITAIEQKRMKKYGRPLTDTVDELPDNVRGHRAIPAVMSEILRQLEEGRSLDDLNRVGILDIGHWKVMQV
jgi:hypothetical protein